MLRLPLSFALFIFALSFSSCIKTKTKGENRLGIEKSPYLQQHAGNPVWWYAWGEEPFKAAKRANKLLFVSVGYSTCHWCHVMEKESFSTKEVADALNESFISIKVDREEHPDVDSVYMQAIQFFRKSGGWPLNVFLTPDGKPFLGSTYFTKENFLLLLKSLSDAWKYEPKEIEQFAQKISMLLIQYEKPIPSEALTDWVFFVFFKNIEKRFDRVHGGMKGQIKFYPSHEMRMLLRIFERSKDKRPLKMAETTLAQMARGGVYDHLGGGFHRYSTDPQWLIPHFEKMLYDQAALASAYLELYQVTGEKEYALIVREILDYLLTDMAAPQGGFYAAEDADSGGKEGAFYLWGLEEIKKLVSAPELTEFVKAYGVTATGNFETKNVLSLQSSFYRKNRSPLLEKALQKLRTERNKRQRPHRDEKIITAWNGLAISALAKAGAVLQDIRYIESAKKAAQFILSFNSDHSGKLLRSWAGGVARHSAYLDDYAFFIDGLIELYHATFDFTWLSMAERMQRTQDELFTDKNFGAYYASTGENQSLVVRPKEFTDTVVPSGNSISALNLLRLGNLFMKQEYRVAALKIIKAAPEMLLSYPEAFSQLMMAIDYSLDRSKEIAVVGRLDDPLTRRMLHALTSVFNPNKVVAAGLPNQPGIPLLGHKEMKRNKTTAFICSHSVCQLPTNEVEKAVQLAEERNPYQLPES